MRERVQDTSLHCLLSTLRTPLRVRGGGGGGGGVGGGGREAKKGERREGRWKKGKRIITSLQPM